MTSSSDFATIPLVDIGPLITGTGDRAATIARLDDASHRCGFFYVTGHGIDVSGLEAQARAFFAQPTADKLAIAMAHGGRAWRGYFPLGGELTSGAPDWKEGIYFGAELVQPRRHARAPIERSLSLHAAPRTQSLRSRSTLDAVLLRPELRGEGADADRALRRRRRTLGRSERAGVRGHVR